MHSTLFSIGPFTIYSYGLMIAIGIMTAFWLSMKLARARGLDPDFIFDIGLIGVICGLAGAKILYWITILPQIIQNPSILLDIGNGFVVYGGLITGILAPVLYAKWKKIPILKYIDSAAPGIAAAQGFGRIGCFLAGCCYGKETSLLIGVTFPQNSLAPAGIKLLPTQLMSSAGDFVISLILLVLLKKQKADGTTISAYLILYAVGRFCIEFLRADERGQIGVLSTSQFIAIFMAIAGSILCTIFQKRKTG